VKIFWLIYSSIWLCSSSSWRGVGFIEPACSLLLLKEIYDLKPSSLESVMLGCLSGSPHLAGIFSEKCFTIRVVRQWHGLPHPCGQPRSGWRGSEHLVELWASLLIAGGLDQVAFKGPFQLKRFYNSHLWCFTFWDAMRLRAGLGLCQLSHVTLQQHSQLQLFPAAREYIFLGEKAEPDVPPVHMQLQHPLTHAHFCNPSHLGAATDSDGADVS